jgi:hypothetical protein
MTVKSAAEEGPDNLKWSETGYSSKDGPTSVVGIAVSPGTVHVRDSTDLAGARNAFSEAAFIAFASCAASQTQAVR